MGRSRTRQLVRLRRRLVVKGESEDRGEKQLRGQRTRGTQERLPAEGAPARRNRGQAG